MWGSAKPSLCAWQARGNITGPVTSPQTRILRSHRYCFHRGTHDARIQSNARSSFQLLRVRMSGWSLLISYAQAQGLPELCREHCFSLKVGLRKRMSSFCRQPICMHSASILQRSSSWSHDRVFLCGGAQCMYMCESVCVCTLTHTHKSMSV